MIVEIGTIFELTDMEFNRLGVFTTREAAEKEIENLVKEFGINPNSMDIEEIPLLEWRADK